MYESLWLRPRVGRLRLQVQVNHLITRLARTPRPTTCGAAAQQLSKAFGDHTGLLGALDSQGQLYFLECSESSDSTTHGPSVLKSQPDSPPIAHLALAGNNRVAATFVQAPNASMTHIVEFESLEKFKDWYLDPAGPENYPDKHHMLQGRTKQLIANTTAFICLMENGNVFTWGDARYRSLGRNTTGPDAVSAAEAGPLEALGGIKIKKISAGGWMAAALSEDGTAYMWGSGTPGSDGSIRVLSDTETGEVGLVEIMDEHTNEPLDIVDIAVGDEHVVLITGTGRLFAVGNNSNGQCGLSLTQQYLEDWTEVQISEGVAFQSVEAGPLCTILKAAKHG